MVDNNSDFSFKVTLNPTLLAFILGAGTATAIVLTVQHTVINNQQSNNEQVQTQIVDCPLRGFQESTGSYVEKF